MDPARTPPVATLRQLQAFCAVARSLSFTRAAVALGCRQPTVSVLIAELERATHLTLFEQLGKHLALTDEGETLYAHAQEVMAATDALHRAMATHRDAAITAPAPLRIAADTTAGTYVLPRLLGAFHRVAPDVPLLLRVANRAEVRTALLDGTANLVIAGRPPAVGGLAIEPFLANRLVVVACPGHVLAGHTHVPLARLAEESFLMREAGSGTRAAVEEVFEIAGVPLRISMVLGHIEAIKQAVMAGLGVSVFSRVAVQRELRDGALALLDVPPFPLERHWYLARLAARPVTASAAAFLDLLRAERDERDSE